MTSGSRTDPFDVDTFLESVISGEHDLEVFDDPGEPSRTDGAPEWTVLLRRSVLDSIVSGAS